MTLTGALESILAAVAVRRGAVIADPSRHAVAYVVQARTAVVADTLVRVWARLCLTALARVRSVLIDVLTVAYVRAVQT